MVVAFQTMTRTRISCEVRWLDEFHAAFLNESRTLGACPVPRAGNPGEGELTSLRLLHRLLTNSFSRRYGLHRCSNHSSPERASGPEGYGLQPVHECFAKNSALAAEGGPPLRAAFSAACPPDDYERGITGNSGNREECPTSAMTAATCSSTSDTLMVYISRPLSYPLSAACFK
jgi:hypothetical protein